MSASGKGNPTQNDIEIDSWKYQMRNTCVYQISRTGVAISSTANRTLVNSNNQANIGWCRARKAMRTGSQRRLENCRGR